MKIAAIERNTVTTSQTTPMPIQKLGGYMQIKSESQANVHVPAAKKSE